MGKIRITESELRQMIQESILQEWGFDNRWRNKNANRQNAYNNALNHYNAINSPDATGVTARDRRQASKQLTRAIGRNGNQFANNIKDLQAANQELTNQNNTLQNQVDTLTQQVTDYSEALTMISNKLGLAKQNVDALEEAAQAQQMTNAQRIAQPALTAINKLQMALANAKMLAQQQKVQQQKAQNNAQMAQTTSTPANPVPQAPAAQPKAPQQGLQRG